MTTYCQHTYRLRFVVPGQGEIVSERPRQKKTELFLDGTAGTQVDVPEGAQGFDVGFALATGAIAPLPCREHPDAPRGASAADGQAVADEETAIAPGLPLPTPKRRGGASG